MSELFKYLEAHFGPTLILAGVILAAFALLRASVKVGQSSVSSPNTGAGRVVATILGCLIAASGGFLMFAKPVEGAQQAFSKQRLRHYTAYISVEGDGDACLAGRCILRYYISGLLEAPPGANLRYVDRAKTAGKILSLVSKPRATILNPEQWPANPTYLEYAIDPPSPDDKQMRVHAEFVLEKRMGSEEGKIGLHVADECDDLTVIVDFRKAGFKPTRIVQPQIEARAQNGVAQTGLVAPIMTVWNDDNILMLLASDLKAESSVVLQWGN